MKRRVAAARRNPDDVVVMPGIVPAVLPSGIEAFARKVVLILQERGLSRTDDEGTTLRDHHGLPRPADRFDAPALAGAAS